MMVKKLDIFVFYFDILGFVNEFTRDGQDTLDRLRSFQRECRNEFCFSSTNTYIVTIFDNVWARVNVTQSGMPSLLLNFAGEVMNAAKRNGFINFFGAITRGIHDFDEGDRVLIGKTDFEDLTEQHIDATSEPHIRAAIAEKWAKCAPTSKSGVWVGEEVCSAEEIRAYSEMPDSTFLYGEIGVDFRELKEEWPFDQCVFHQLIPKSVASEA